MICWIYELYIVETSIDCRTINIEEQNSSELKEDNKKRLISIQSFVNDKSYFGCVTEVHWLDGSIDFAWHDVDNIIGHMFSTPPITDVFWWLTAAAFGSLNPSWHGGFIFYLFGIICRYIRCYWIVAFTGISPSNCCLLRS